MSDRNEAGNFEKNTEEFQKNPRWRKARNSRENENPWRFNFFLIRKVIVVDIF